MPEKKNSLVPDNAPKTPLNHLADKVFGDNDQYRAYLGLYGPDDSTMTERTLSPAGQDFIRAMGAHNLGKGAKPNSFGTAEYPYDHPHDQAMYEVLGNVAKNNVRLVNIAGVPYYQVLDRYDYDLGEDFIKKHGWGETLNGLVTGRYARREAEEIAGGLGLSRNLNYLVPVDPSRSAPPEAVDAHRKKTDLPYPSQTLGTKVMNALRGAATPKHNEKAMP
jgi:hypothetical protein